MVLALLDNATADAIDREYGSKVVGEVTLDQVYGGARGIKSLVWEVRKARARFTSWC